MNIIDLEYFGTIDFIKSIIKQKEVVFDITQPYTKMSFKNRTVIATAQGPLHLSIPILGGRGQHDMLKDIKIAYHSPWNEHHYKALISSYQRAPFFEYYQADLKLIYQSKPVFLTDFLLQVHEWVRKQTKGNWEFIVLHHENDKQESNSMITTQKCIPKNYDLLPDPLIYQQVFEERVGFLPNLSILDLLFCCGGKQSNNLLSV
jgi:hypothetical protein